jgi:hypothetical protein
MRASLGQAVAQSSTMFHGAKVGKAAAEACEAGGIPGSSMSYGTCQADLRQSFVVRYVGQCLCRREGGYGSAEPVVSGPDSAGSTVGRDVEISSLAGEEIFATVGFACLLRPSWRGRRRPGPSPSHRRGSESRMVADGFRGLGSRKRRKAM